MTDSDDAVELYIFGLRSLVPEPIQARANLDTSWYEFLNDVCGIKVAPEDNVMAATTSYSLPAKRGWSVDLSEKVRNFVEKFTVKKGKYSVRLMTQLTPNTNAALQSPTSDTEEDRLNVTSNRSNRKNASGSSSSSSESNSSERNGTRKRRASRSIGKNDSSRDDGIAREEEVEDDYSLDINDALEVEIHQEDSVEIEVEDQGDVSISRIVPTRVGVETGQEGSRIEKGDLKSLIKSRLKSMRNPFLLRVRNEMKRLQRKRFWYRCVQVAPLCSYLMQELLEEKRIGH